MSNDLQLVGKLGRVIVMIGTVISLCLALVSWLVPQFMAGNASETADGAPDAEALLVHPDSGELYVIVKERGLKPTRVYKTEFIARADKAVVKRAGSFELPGEDICEKVVTSRDISPDGRLLITSEGVPAPLFELDSVGM